jgi:hypothetical protein
MEIKLEIFSIHSQAKNWILAGLKRNLTEENKEDILKLCEDTGKELKFSVEKVGEFYTFRDLQ